MTLVSIVAVQTSYPGWGSGGEGTESDRKEATQVLSLLSFQEGQSEEELPPRKGENMTEGGDMGITEKLVVGVDVGFQETEAEASCLRMTVVGGAAQPLSLASCF